MGSKLWSTGIGATLFALMIGHPADAGEADVEAVSAYKLADGSYHFSVTVKHEDKGWKHYADRWEILAPDGSVLGTRVLLHPHETEQPFTRSLSSVQIPGGIPSVTVRAHDSVHGYGGKTKSVPLSGK